MQFISVCVICNKRIRRMNITLGTGCNCMYHARCGSNRWNQTAAGGGAQSCPCGQPWTRNVFKV
jgi:hypothetical protein